MTSVRISVIASLALAASIGSAAAETYVAPSQYSALYTPTLKVYGSGQDFADRTIYDHSGSRGRLDIGANAARPEGPGNFSD